MEFKYKKYIDKSLIYIIFAVIILIFVLGFSFFRAHNEKSLIEDFGRSISEVNLTNDLDSENITSENYIKSIEDKILKLSDIDSNLKSLSVSPKRQDLLSPLQDGLSKNLELYNKILLILKTPDSSKLSEEYEIALKLKEECENNYYLCRANLVPVYLYKESSTYLQDIFYYINELIKTNRDKGFIQSQKNDFVVSIKSILLKLSSMDEKLFETAKLIRESNRDLKVLVNDINTKNNSLQELKNDLYSLPIPEQANDCFIALENTLNSYGKYISYFLENLLGEIDGNKTPNDYYEKSEELFNEFIKSFDIAESTLDNYMKN
ncbi:hypothetical protein [Clostridium sp. B9]|uniref:hypothetical protein n=1 Tax=Clostridium sp. B9 TaxID=3423224 RepID=UPI003D2EC7F7